MSYPEEHYMLHQNMLIVKIVICYTIIDKHMQRRCHVFHGAITFVIRCNTHLFSYSTRGHDGKVFYVVQGNVCMYRNILDTYRLG